MTVGEHVSGMDQSAGHTFRVATIVGGLFIVLGIAAYVLSDFASVTALIPTLLGIPILVLAYLGSRPGPTRLTRYAVGILALVTIVGAVPAIGDLLAGEALERPTATGSQLVMLVLGVILLGAVVADLRSA